MENNLPLISVIMSVFNGETFVAQSIKSVLDQTVTDFEFLIIDDFSSDKTVSIIESFDDPRIRLLKNSSNKGLPESLNYLLTITQGKYIARMDADDVCHKNRFEWQVDYLEKNPQISLCGMWAYQIDSHSKFINRVKLPTKSHCIKSALFWSNCIPHPSIMARAGYFKGNIYNKEFSKAQDYELWQRTSKTHLFANVPKFGICYRISDQQISQKHKGDQNKFSEQVQTRNLQLLVDASESQVQMHLIMANQKESLSFKDLFEWSEFLLNANARKQIYERKSFSYFTFRIIGLNLIKSKCNIKDIIYYIKKMMIWRVYSIRLILKLLLYWIQQIAVNRE